MKCINWAHTSGVQGRNLKCTGFSPSVFDWLEFNRGNEVTRVLELLAHWNNISWNNTSRLFGRMKKTLTKRIPGRPGVVIDSALEIT